MGTVRRPVLLLLCAAAVSLPAAQSEAAGAAAAPPAKQHRIDVRLKSGSGELFDRVTKRRFVARGSNYVRLNAAGHATFNVGAYSKSRSEVALSRMQALGFNTARVFLASECATGCIGAPGGGISRAYVRNLADFLQRAKRHRIFVVLTTGFLPAGYSSLIVDSPLVDDVNLIPLTPGGIRAYQMFWRDVVLELRRQRAALDDVLAYDIFNELAFVLDHAPFTLASGVLHAPSGTAYDLSDTGAKERLLGEGMVSFVNRVRAAIRKVDPTALVSASYFQPRVPNPNRFGDTRDLRTAPVIASSALDLVDLHAYPGLELSLPQYMQNFGVEGSIRKPLLMGELGAFREAYPDSADAAAALVDWQAASCSYGFDGWLVWTWDTDEQPELWNGLSQGGAIAAALAPRNRPDPCAPPPGPRDLALGKPVIASAQAAGPAANAVDGNSGTIWNAGADPPQWIEVDLGAPVTVARVRLRVAQFPAQGATVHRVYTRGPGPGDPLVLRRELSGTTSDGEVLDVSAGGPWGNVRYVRIETIASPSWAAWREIEVLG
jgi:hypothetical protein